MLIVLFFGPSAVLRPITAQTLQAPRLGRLIVKLRLILSPQAELSSTSTRFSALTALPRRLLFAELRSPERSAPSKLNAELVGLCGDSCGDGLGPPGDRAVALGDASLPAPRGSAGPSKP